VTVGILGGTFDPPHNGHVELARAALDALELDRLLVVVVGEAPHKPVETDAETRFRLAEAAFRDIPGVELSRHELERPGPSYTVDTAAWADERYGDVVLVIGADEFADFPRWREPNRILEHARVAVAARPGTDPERVEAVRAQLARPDRVLTFPLEPLPISSREIRARVARGEPIADVVPPAVAELVAELGLYRAGARL
jgi:nicotinate-nucleotide adenylyltransferase